MKLLRTPNTEAHATCNKQTCATVSMTSWLAAALTGRKKAKVSHNSQISRQNAECTIHLLLSLEHPIKLRLSVFVLAGAQGMRDSFQSIHKRACAVICWIHL